MENWVSALPFCYYNSVITSLHPLGPLIASCALRWYLRLVFLKFTILVDPSLVIISIYLVCLIYASDERNNAFSRNDLYGHTLE